MAMVNRKSEGGTLKVELLSSRYPCDLERYVNDFIASRDVDSLQYSSCCDGNYATYSCMVVYTDAGEQK